MTRAWPKSGIVTFCRPSEELGALSNFSRLPVIVNGCTVPTSEALYQALKFPQRPDIQRAICAMPTPAAAKRLAYHYLALIHPNWHAVKVPVMGWVVRVKFVQHRIRLIQTLAGTGRRPLVEYSARDRFWGAVPNDQDRRALYGANMLGRLWTRIRDLHATDPARLLVVEPLPVETYGFAPGVSIQPDGTAHHLPGAPAQTPDEQELRPRQMMVGFLFLGRPIETIRPAGMGE